MKPDKLHILKHELSEHFKYTILSVAIIITAGIFLSKYSSYIFGEPLFTKFHITHLFLASVTPVSIFYSYKKNALYAILLGVFSSAIGCSASDSLIPYIGGQILGYNMFFHICLFDEPELAWPALILGALTGIFFGVQIRKHTKITHLLHGLVAASAGLIYMLAFGVTANSIEFVFIILILIVSVSIPCLFTDIAVPGIFLSGAEPHHHH